MDTLRQVQIAIGGRSVQAWEAKSPSLQLLGRWTDPKALLRRIHQIEHPNETVEATPGRQWQATWRGGFSTRGRPRKGPMNRPRPSPAAA